MTRCTALLLQNKLHCIAMITVSVGLISTGNVLGEIQFVSIRDSDCLFVYPAMQLASLSSDVKSLLKGNSTSCSHLYIKVCLQVLGSIAARLKQAV